MKFKSLLFFCVIQAFALAGHAELQSPTPGESDYVIFPPVFAGEALVVNFTFSEAQVSSAGPANSIVFNLGGTSTEYPLQHNDVSLYSGRRLIGAVSSKDCLACALFSSVPLQYFWSDQVSKQVLDKILKGKVTATIVFTPTFSNASGSATLSGYKPHAGTATAPLSLIDIYPAPQITYEVITAPYVPR
jgi:hypothetical protein